MSDPKTKQEVDRLLISIKRLIRENSRLSAEEILGDEHSMNRLVLTPDQRVGQVEPEQPLADESPPGGEVDRKMAALQAVIARRTEEWEPADTERSMDATRPRMAWSRPDLREETPPETGAQRAPALADNLFVDDLPEYDEAFLRDLISEVLREELQGALGEKITRNVRKLVRREINRAFTARSFE